MTADEVWQEVEQDAADAVPPRSPLATVTDLYERFNSGGLEAVLELFEPEVEWCTLSDVPEAGVYRGRAAVRRFLGQALEAFDSMRIAVDELLVRRSQVVGVIRYLIRGGASGVDLEMPIVQVFDVAAGRVARVREYPTKDQALAAVDS